MAKIEIPTNCPACNAELVIHNYQLFCRNKTCTAQQHKTVEHFCKTLKIKGLGPASIKKLQINSVEELYNQRIDEMEYLLGSTKLAEKIAAEIERSKNASLNQVLPAFGIPLVGNTASKKLCSIISSLDELSEEACIAAGLGPTVTSNLLNWFYGEFPLIKDALPFSFKSEEVREPTKSLGVVCISGRLTSYKTKAEATKALEAAGYTVKSTVTKDTTHLVNESQVESSKTKKARETGIVITTNINELIG